MISSISSNAAAFAAQTTLNRPAASDTGSDISSALTKPSAKDAFMKFMKESPAERMEDMWLQSHGLDKDKLAAMSPQEREKVLKQMKDDIERSLKEQTQKGTTVDLTA